MSLAYISPYAPYSTHSSWFFIPPQCGERGSLPKVLPVALDGLDHPVLRLPFLLDGHFPLFLKSESTLTLQNLLDAQYLNSGEHV
ncbi:hypothetical protein AKJ41_04285 [candidate division MSBL1 archaeon SCGC-AAA259O05]|uniref:Uncharacterized protein n=1 Tax=candidate division MSBL1 archaeon SCGC-AAA259O05 TaxID=1698271 RepID=A0A133V155_9EURY|nr:hypothetical protein AKJ41_04285 [candidate division MSBL1 archaeon SCGC-AAA259O05]